MSRMVNTEFEALMVLASKRCRDEGELLDIRKAFGLASDAHRNVLTHTGEPYILRCIDVARIVLEKVGLGYKSICAALLMDVPGNLYYTLDDIRLGFGDKIAQLVEGLQNINKILSSTNAPASLGKDEESERQAENFKTVLLTLGDDVRVVLIKLADRLQDCRHLDTLPKAKRDRILSETMFIFIPLAHRLGLYSIKSEMENFWLKYEQPQAYTDIMSRIDKDVSARTRDVDEFIAPINDALNEKGYVFEIKKRIKTPYSIWYKMKNKGVPYEQIYDIYAVRIIFDPDSPRTEREQAYAIYSIITRMYTDKPSRTRDWIKQPKSNGYE
ncbi:MAG: bifunctional (p)ppGpp synthetase/guanosine-3',5'-bis(diphosphate) 3'-pyrophosphohydrolase, partial [Bacteroidales bacterium]|nr:bifunctional (p)ppGpp synthetase/guanosine-3',5'-bis(diphosphate) 3'-pyrophosphohydrolase [Bacteroidales bacterium]